MFHEFTNAQLCFALKQTGYDQIFMIKKNILNWKENDMNCF